MPDRLADQITVSDHVDRGDRRYAITVFRGAEDVRGALQALREDARALTLFQTSTWLNKTYQHLAPVNRGEPHLVVVHCANDGAFILALPLVVVQENGLRLAGFPDFGLSDYGAPLVSAHSTVKFSAEDAKVLWKSICKALTGVDRLSLTNMPLALSGGCNPLARVKSAMPSAHARYVVEVDDTIETFLVSRGKKYRKEVERCYRLLADQGDWHFECAQTHPEIAAAFDALDSLQAERWQGQEGVYGLKVEAVAQFYKEALFAGDDRQAAQIFTLRSGQETIAVLYGVVFQQTFTLLRVASASGQWRRLSPGRLVIIEAMRHFVGDQITSFDLGIGDYAFKRGLGAKAFPLVDIEQALTWKAKPHVVLMQAKGWLRRHPRLLQAAKAARQKMSR